MSFLMQTPSFYPFLDSIISFHHPGVISSPPCLPFHPSKFVKSLTQTPSFLPLLVSFLLLRATCFSRVILTCSYFLRQLSSHYPVTLSSPSALPSIFSSVFTHICFISHVLPSIFLVMISHCLICLTIHDILRSFIIFSFSRHLPTYQTLL